MIYFKLMTVVFIVSVVQVCMSNPVSPEVDSDPAKLFTAEDLLRAKNAGLPEGDFIYGISSGLTLDEMVKLSELRLKEKNNANASERLTKWCEILAPGQKVASSYTSAQETKLLNLIGAAELLPGIERFAFFRTSLCTGLSQPNLHSFSPNFVPHAIIRWLKGSSERYSGRDRVKISKVMCCFEGLGDNTNVQYEKFNEFGEHADSLIANGLSDVDMHEFEEQWNHFNHTNVPDSIKRMRDFLQAKNLTDDDECKRILSFVVAK